MNTSTPSQFSRNCNPNCAARRPRRAAAIRRHGIQSAGRRVTLYFLVAAVAAINLAIFAAPAAAQRCVGDCDGNGTVSIGELQTAVRISLDLDEVVECSAIDVNADRHARVDELIAAIGAALGDCRQRIENSADYPCPWPDVVDGDIHAFLMAGQSNMRGVGRPEDVPEPLRTGDLRILRHRDYWQVLRPDEQFFGPELTFARTVAAACPNSTIGVVKYARAATGINAWLRQWDEALAELSNSARFGPLYPQLMQRAFAAQADADVSWEGFVWVHGQSDKPLRQLAEAYGDNMVALIAAVREDLDSPRLPFIFEYRNFTHSADTELRSAPLLANLPVGLQIVEDQKRQALDVIPYSYAADWTDLKTFDLAHLFSDGYLAAGRLLAEAFLLR